MITRTQIIEGLKAAKHEHSLDCKYQLRHGQACCCTCNAKRPNAAIAAAITWIEKQEAEQVPVAYPSADQAIQWRAEWFRVGEGDEPPFIAARAIDWYRSQHPATKPADEQTVGLSKTTIAVALMCIDVLAKRIDPEKVSRESLDMATSELKSWEALNGSVD